jgi:hypothetical protein
MSERDWPFDEPRDRAVFSAREIIFEGEPILFVSHDNDGDWPFLTGASVDKEDAAVVGLGEIAELDPTVLRLADLPTGWMATRRSANANWERSARS